MNRPDQAIFLIAVSEVDNGAGTIIVVDGEPRLVFAQKKSVARSEFYQAIANNLKPTATFEMYKHEYQDEQKLSHEGKDYLILRTYSKDNQAIELVCQAFDDVQTNLAQLRDSIEVWKNAFVENSMGEKSPSPQLLYTLPAHIQFNGGGTSKDDGVIETTNNAVVTIRYREQISQDMFLKINGQRWDIKTIKDPFNRHQTLVLTVERVIP